MTSCIEETDKLNIATLQVNCGSVIDMGMMLFVTRLTTDGAVAAADD